MLKRHEVEILLKVGHAQTEVARLAGVSLCSVKRIAEEAPVVHVDDAAEREKRRIGRPSIVEDFRKLVVKILEEKPDLPSLEILRRVREAGYQGGKTALYALVASVRPKEIKPLIRFEGLPGEFSQHDFGQVDVAFLDGSIRRIHFFASRLKYSRFIRVSVVKNKPLTEWGKVLHDEDMAAAILDRVLERGRFIHLDGPSGRTRHLNLEETLPENTKRLRISGTGGSEFPEPTFLSHWAGKRNIAILSPIPGACLQRWGISCPLKQYFGYCFSSAFDVHLNFPPNPVGNSPRGDLNHRRYHPYFPTRSTNQIETLELT
jgi:IstB-like ATP binding protein